MFGRLTFALPKGRIFEQAIPLLRAAGIELGGVGSAGDRRLMIDVDARTRVLLVKPTDVPTYVEHGIADVGIAGRDTLEEAARDLYEPVDLGIGRCRMAVAASQGAPASLPAGERLRVATKYPRVAARHYKKRGIDVEVISLSGSVELGPITGLADRIVDLVESGETLRQNGLVELETIFQVSSKLVVHPASLKLKQERITELIHALRVHLQLASSMTASHAAQPPASPEKAASKSRRQASPLGTRRPREVVTR